MNHIHRGFGQTIREDWFRGLIELARDITFTHKC